LVAANDRARALFRLGGAEVGRPLSELDVSYRPVDVRQLIDEAYADRRTVVRVGVEWRPPGTTDLRWFDLHVTPLHGDNGTYVGTSLSFLDTTALRQLQNDLEQSEHELQAAYEELQSAYEELQSTNEELQATNEELETTNEELQSTVEELETTNEELQSTNEELETMNEELQSTNEELQSMNEELRTRGDQVDAANRFLDRVLTSLRQGVAVLDPGLRILAWNSRASDLWGVHPAEARDTHFLKLDIGLPVHRLHEPIRNAMTTKVSEELVLPATNRRGKAFQCRVLCSPLATPDGDGEDPAGVIVLMEEAPAAAD